MLKLSVWNVNGWTISNQTLRQRLISSIASDVICLCETHLCDRDELFVEDYAWFGHNRQSRHVRSVRGSGGVGILIRNDLLTQFKVAIVDISMEGLLGISLTHRTSGVSVAVFVCYLPPTTSVWGRDSDSFFAHLLGQMYLCSDYDHIILCGDFNARVGNESDTIPDIDSDLGPRNAIDNVKSGHYESFLEFVKDSRMCLVNGRVTPEFDKFTCVSTRGKSVVYYHSPG